MRDVLLELAPAGMGVGLAMIVIGVLRLRMYRMFKEDDDE